MDPRDKTAQVDLLRGLESFQRVADAIDVWLMLRGGEYVARRQPAAPGTTVTYDKATERVAYSGDSAYVIALGPTARKRWWQR